MVQEKRKRLATACRRLGLDQTRRRAGIELKDGGKREGAVGVVGEALSTYGEFINEKVA
jgi:hypothetical protein